MDRDQGIGVVILVVSLAGIVIYAWLLYNYAILILQITTFVAVAAVLLIAAWIGWTMTTTPPPALLEPEPTSQTTSSGDSR